MSERMWCTACGTVTADNLCDCNRYGVGHEMYREPHFVNYADAMQQTAHEQAQEINALVKALEEIVVADSHADLPPGQCGSIAIKALSASIETPSPLAQSSQPADSDRTGGGEPSE